MPKGDSKPLSYDEATTLGWCWDCEAVVLDDSPLCGTCLAHRRDGHDPVEWGDGYCHGAGPLGNDERLLDQEPRSKRWAETTSASRVPEGDRL